MPKIVPTRFTEFEFTPAELYAATRFSDLTCQLIQTMIAKAASEKVALTVDPTKQHEFLQREACLTGQIEAYENLLALVENTPKPAEQGEPVVNSAPPTTF